MDLAKGVTTDFDDHQSYNAWGKLKKLLKWGGRKARVTQALPMRVNSAGEVIPDASDQAEHDLKHFGDVEKAQYCTQDQLVDSYNQAQRTQPRTTVPLLTNTPSRADLTRLFRHASRGRSAGPDMIVDDLMAAAPFGMSRLLRPLLTKMSFLQIEHLALKGAYFDLISQKRDSDSTGEGRASDLSQQHDRQDPPPLHAQSHHEAA